MRNHNTISKSALIDGLAKAIPERHKVDLDTPEVFILVEIFKVRGRCFPRTYTGADFVSEYVWHERCEGLLPIAQVQRHGDRTYEDG